MPVSLTSEPVCDELVHTTFVVRLHPRYDLGVGEVLNLVDIGPLAVADPATHVRDHRFVDSVYNPGRG